VPDETHENIDPDPLFRFMDLAQTEDGRWTPRLRLPENTPADKLTERANGAMYWSGAWARWSDLQESVDAGKGIALLPHRSGLVVLDCDVRMRDGDGFVITGDGRAKWSGAQVDRGYDDLMRVVIGMGQVLPKTWTVRTKSGGMHVYFRCAPNQLRSSGHREGWCIDVKASVNTWVVAPPTAGYSVVDDAPPAAIPAWLASWLVQDLHRVTEPLGGAARAERSKATKIRYEQVKYGTYGGSTEATRRNNLEVSGLAEQWRTEILLRVREANLYGGWNNEIYQAVCMLRDAGHAKDDIEQWVVEAASPWDDRERRTAHRTVASALARVGGGA
jgi:Bifunctional DNA primase/polymerase, N-terminal